MPFKRLPNGFGTVTKLSGNRRKPYRAMKRVGLNENGKPIYQAIGYYATKSEAIKALTDHDGILVEKPPTVLDVYKLWKTEYEMKKPLPNTYDNAFQKIRPLHYRKIADLKALDLERVVNSNTIPRTTKYVISVVLHGIYGYAMRHEMVMKDYSHIANFNYDVKVQIQRNLYTADEINALDPDKFYERATLIMLYTGLRISELGKLKTSDIHYEERYMVGGVKTAAGKNRIIPIHEEIAPLIKMQLEIAGNRSTFYCDDKHNFIIKDSLYAYYVRNGISHSPHDTRHTFVTQAYLCGMDENILKRIVGHTLNGVTQSVYVHMPIETLVAEINKLHY